MSKTARGSAMRLLAALVVLAALAAGCGNGDGNDLDSTPSPSPSTPSPTEDGSEPAAADDIDQSRTYLAKVHAEGTGAAAFTWDGEQKIVLTRVGGPDIDVNVISAGFKDPEKLTTDPAYRFRWAFDLLKAYEDKPATFEIGGDAVNAQGLKSQAFLIWMKVKDPAKDAVFDMDEVEFFKRFDQVQRPCTVEIGEDMASGALRCPALATAEGEVAGLTVTWEEIPA